MLQAIVAADLAALKVERTGELLVSLVASIRACLEIACLLPEGVEVAVGAGVGALAANGAALPRRGMPSGVSRFPELSVCLQCDRLAS
jgi:hypothetical protein